MGIDARADSGSSKRHVSKLFLSLSKPHDPFFDLPCVSLEFLAEARAQRLRNDPAALARSLRAAGTGTMAPLHDRLADCVVPTTVVAGADDPKFTAIAAGLAAAIRRAEVVLIEGAGHAAHLERPDAVTAAIRARMAAT